MAELAEKRPVVAEIYPQSSRNREYPLPVRDIGKHFTIEAMSKQQGSLLSATGTTTTSPARKRYKKLGFTVRATDTGKSLLEVAAFEELLDGRPNHRTPISIPFLIPFRIYSLELIKIVTHYLEKR